ncbi:hypothetical protein CJF31_00006442 [Rutstroemia sp. NJR-2017a BVV2]|nr:hypothetical protein CJF31_00006442 [Rutstroemia sp. NJR-2017a BVV2]
MSNKTGGLDSSYYPPTPSLPKFSQSVGPGGRATSPFVKKTRSSTQRPESPVRRPATTRPSLSTPQPRIPSRYTSASPAPGKFGQSVRGTQDSRDPSKRVGYTSKNGMKPSITPRSASALGGPGTGPMNLSDDDATPVRVARTTTNGSISSVSSFSAKLRPASRAASRANDDELDRLRSQLEDRERQLRDQASSLADMENSLLEVQALMNSTDSDMNSNQHNRNSMEDTDAAQLRMILREKNEKIAMLTAEFDAHRADFRSTIDTLELASTETERVYEKRVDDLLMELREMQERSEDVDSVARQLKQLEELVQELEEGLEDARRGEAEARGEVEFLRGEVERTRSELRREREKTAEAISNANANSNGDAAALTKELQQRDDEIRGLKAIIHSLSRDGIPDTSSPTPDMDKTPTHRPSLSRSQQTSASVISKDDKQAREKLEQEVRELRAMLESKENKEEQMERELEGLRRGSVSNPPAQRTSALSTATVTQDRDSYRDSKGTNGSWHDRDRAPEPHRNTLDPMPESDTYSSAAESFCELCETSGHDILTCTNMFGPGGHTRNASGPPQRTGKDVVMEVLKLSPKPLQQQDENVNKDTPAPLSPQKKSSPVVETPPVKVTPNPMESGPAAGKESGVIDMDKWCGVCEREGHDSIDCPFEDAF